MSRDSLLKTRLLSHCTCEVRDIEKSRRFYEDVLGLEVVMTGPKSLMARKNSVTVIDAIETATQNRANKNHSHMGFDVASKAEIDAIHELMEQIKDEYEISDIRKVNKTMRPHNNYNFTIVDRDGNTWEFLDNPAGGYRWKFEQDGDLVEPHMPNREDGKDWRDLVDPATNRMEGVKLD